MYFKLLELRALRLIPQGPFKISPVKINFYGNQSIINTVPSICSGNALWRTEMRGGHFNYLRLFAEGQRGCAHSNPNASHSCVCTFILSFTHPSEPLWDARILYKMSKWSNPLVCGLWNSQTVNYCRGLYCPVLQTMTNVGTGAWDPEI